MYCFIDYYYYLVIRQENGGALHGQSMFMLGFNAKVKVLFFILYIENLNCRLKFAKIPPQLFSKNSISQYLFSIVYIIFFFILCGKRRWEKNVWNLHMAPLINF